MKYVHYIILCCAVFLLASCATVSNPHQEPSASQPHATIHGKENASIFAGKRRYIFIDSLDGRKIGTVWSAESKIRLAPGAHTVKATVIFHQVNLLASANQTATVTLHWNAVAGENYSVEATLNGDRITAWVVNRYGQAVSAKASAAHLPAGSKVVQLPEFERN